MLGPLVSAAPAALQKLGARKQFVAVLGTQLTRAGCLPCRTFGSSSCSAPHNYPASGHLPRCGCQMPSGSSSPDPSTFGSPRLLHGWSVVSSVTHQAHCFDGRAYKLECDPPTSDFFPQSATQHHHKRATHYFMTVSCCRSASSGSGPPARQTSSAPPPSAFAPTQPTSRTQAAALAAAHYMSR